VSTAVLSWINYKWIPLKIQSVDARVFDRYRLKDYADCLWRNGLRLPGCCAFVDGTFHKTYRPGADEYNGLLHRAFYSGDKKTHGLVFEMILFPDGMVGRAFGPVAGRRHDLFLAKVSRRLHLSPTAPFKDSASSAIKHTLDLAQTSCTLFLILMRAPSRPSGMSTLRDTVLRSST